MKISNVVLTMIFSGFPHKVTQYDNVELTLLRSTNQFENAILIYFHYTHEMEWNSSDSGGIFVLQFSVIKTYETFWVKLEKIKLNSVKVMWFLISIQHQILLYYILYGVHIPVIHIFNTCSIILFTLDKPKLNKIYFITLRKG